MITEVDEIKLITHTPTSIDIKKKIGYFTPIASTTIVIYVWSLPYLSTIGFSEPNSTSISGFIANAHATGALAALSFRPLNLMWEYQNYMIRNIQNNTGKIILGWTMASYQFFYGGFLVCTVNYVPNWLHTCTVTLFIISFMFHSSMTLYYTTPNKIGQIELIIGVLACMCLPFAKDLWFWGFECVGYSMMMLFTPTEILCLPSV
tara:strand:- start:844 stop:1458 length:615 start_codon:yes stop_codon:yes gene_type:complete